MAVTVPSWQQAPTVWDKLKLGNDWLPGPVEVDVPDIDSGLDVRKAPKTNRAQLVDQGYNLVTVTVTMTIGFESLCPDWSSASDQFKQWQAILERIRPKRAQKRVSLSVSHPQLVLAGISAVYVRSVSGLKGSGPGVRTVTLKLVEQAPISAASPGTTVVGKPKGSVDLATLNKAANPAATQTKP